MGLLIKKANETAAFCRRAAQTLVEAKRSFEKLQRDCESTIGILQKQEHQCIKTAAAAERDYHFQT